MLVPFAEIDLEACKLGQDEVLIGFNARSEMVELAALLITQGQNQVVFYGEKMDGTLFGSKQVVDALDGFIRNHRLAPIQTLVKSSQQLVYSGHRIVELLRSHMPTAECRNRKIRSDQHGGSFLLVDKLGYIYLPQADRFVGSACFYHPSTCLSLYDVFEQEWQVASPDPEMQSLSL